MEMAWKVILQLLYYKQLFGTPIISDNRLPLLTEYNFRTPILLFGPPLCLLIFRLSVGPPSFIKTPTYYLELGSNH